MPTLLYCDVDGVDRTYELGPTPIVIGRATDCAIRSDDPRMSRHHARVFFDGTQCWIEDLGSANGVFVGRDRVSQAVVPPGEVALVGSILVQIVGAQGALPPTAGVHAQLSHWLAMERKTRASIEEERTALARRIGELIGEMTTQARAASNELTAVLLQRDEAMHRADRLEEQSTRTQDEGLPQRDTAIRPGMEAAATATSAAAATAAAAGEEQTTRDRAANLAAKLLTTQQRVTGLEAQLEDATERLGEASSERDRVRDELGLIEHERDELKTQLATARTDRDRLTTELEGRAQRAEAAIVPAQKLAAAAAHEREALEAEDPLEERSSML